MKFVPDPICIPELATAPEMGAMLRSRAEAVKRAVHDIAPVDETAPHYRDMLDVDVDLEHRTYVGRVIAQKFTAVFLEFGVYGHPGSAPLRRGTEATGLKLGRPR